MAQASVVRCLSSIKRTLSDGDRQINAKFWWNGWFQQIHRVFSSSADASLTEMRKWNLPVGRLPSVLQLSINLLPGCLPNFNFCLRWSTIRDVIWILKIQIFTNNFSFRWHGTLWDGNFKMLLTTNRIRNLFLTCPDFLCSYPPYRETIFVFIWILTILFCSHRTMWGKYVKKPFRSHFLSVITFFLHLAENGLNRSIWDWKFQNATFSTFSTSMYNFKKVSWQITC